MPLLDGEGIVVPAGDHLVYAQPISQMFLFFGPRSGAGALTLCIACADSCRANQSCSVSLASHGAESFTDGGAHAGSSASDKAVAAGRA